MNSAAASAPAIDDGEIIFEIPDSFRIYRSGRVERLFEDVLVDPSLDPATQVQSKDVVINPSTGLSVRLYLPPAAASTDRKLPILVSVHGGGFCLLRSSSSIYQRFINPLTANARVLTVSIDYRLAPEHPLPAAYDDCWEALSWVFGRGGADDPWLSKFGDLDNVFLSGESAGGNIVHYLAMRLGREGSKVEGLMMLHPFFWGEQRIGNEGEDAKERKVQEAAALWKTVCPATTGLDDPLINPVADGARSLADLGCRRVLVCVAELDLLRDRGRNYYEKLKESGWGAVAEFLESEGLDHGFFFRHVGLKTEELRERMVNFINNSSIAISDEAPSFEIITRPFRHPKRRDLMNRVYASDEARGYAMEKAEELQSQLDQKYPSFMKPMLQSHVTGGFWLGLTKSFCSKYLPKSDTWFSLIDEEDDESQTLYLAPKVGLSAGWRGFAIAHELVDGDALVFHLISPTKFKVYIIRCSGYYSSDLH